VYRLTKKTHAGQPPGLQRKLSRGANAFMNKASGAAVAAHW
jgi:hypothetical protein